MADDKLSRVLKDLVDRMQEPLGLDRWTVTVSTGPFPDTASCAAQPEYRRAAIEFDLDKLETGDEPDELAAHELSHCDTATIHDVAIGLAHCVAECAPEYMREPIRKKLQEEVRWAAEYTTTRVGHSYIRLLRRWWKAEADLTALRRELAALKKQAKAD